MEVAITGTLIFNIKFYLENIAGCYSKADDQEGIYIEHVLYKMLKNKQGAECKLLKRTPVYMGKSGSYGGSLNRHPFKVKVRNVERKLFRLLKVNKFQIEY